MITSFETGAAFKIIDQATPVLKKILDQIKLLNVETGGVLKSLKAIGALRLDALASDLARMGDQAAIVNKEMGGIARAMARVTSPGRIGAFDAVTGAIDAQALAVGKLALNWGSVSGAATAAQAASRRASVPLVAPGSGGGGRGGRHGPRSGFHVSGVSTPLPGGHASFRGGGNAAMAGAGALAYGVYAQAELEDAIFQMKWHAGLPNTPANDKYFRDLIQSTASRTGFGYKEIAEAATDEIRLLKGAEGKESGGLDILPEMLRAAALETKVKPGTTLKGAMDSLVEQAHMAQEYGIEDIKGMAPLLAFLSTTNPATMPQMTRAASYAMPTLHSALNMDPADVLYETTAIARAGATNTKSGTWVRAAFERSLPPDPNVVGDKEYARRMFAMEKIGLVDKKGKSTVLDPTGKHLDINKLLTSVQKATDTLPLIEKNAYMKKVFGEQGERGMFLMMSPAVMAQTAELKKEYPEFHNRYETFFEDYERESPVQKARQTWEDLTNVLADIGTFALPPLIEGLREFDKVLKAIHEHWPEQGHFGGVPEKDSLGEKLGKGMAAGGIAGIIAGGLMGLAGGPLAPASVPAGMLWGGLYGATAGGAAYGGSYIFNKALEDPWGDTSAGPQLLNKDKQSNAEEPSRTIQLTTNFYLDGRVLARAVTQHQVIDGNGAAEGAPYPDLTRGGSSLDYGLG